MLSPIYGRALKVGLVAALGGCADGIASPGEVVIPVMSTRLAVTGIRTCLLERDGQVVCWGSGEVARVTPADGSLRFLGISGGVQHVCGIATDSTAWCWGSRNNFGELGDGTLIQRLRPTRVETDLKFVVIAAGGYSTCALDPGGTLYCWGSNGTAALANGRFNLEERELTPAPGRTSVRFKSLAGVQCGVSLSGRAYCWGTLRGFGTLDDDPEYAAPGRCKDWYYRPFTLGDCLVPTPVKTSLRFEAFQGCGLDATGKAYCVGNGYFGQLGDGRSGMMDGVPVHAIEPVPVVGGVTFRQLAGPCGIDLAGKAYCWGSNGGAGLGIGYVGGVVPEPTPALTDARFVEIAYGGNMCGLTADDEVWCWGGNDLGQLGPSFPFDRSNKPVKVGLPPL